MVKGLKHFLFEERLRDHNCAVRRRLKRDLFTVYKYLKCRSQDVRVNSSMVCSNRARGNRKKLEHRKILKQGKMPSE